MIQKKLDEQQAGILVAFTVRYAHYARYLLQLYLAGALFSWVAVGWSMSLLAAIGAAIYMAGGWFWVRPIWLLLSDLKKDGKNIAVEEFRARVIGAKRRQTLFGEEEHFLLTEDEQMLVADSAMLLYIAAGDEVLICRTVAAKLVLAVS
jgi:hypothetical protein